MEDGSIATVRLPYVMEPGLSIQPLLLTSRVNGVAVMVKISLWEGNQVERGAVINFTLLINTLIKTKKGKRNEA